MFCREGSFASSQTDYEGPLQAGECTSSLLAGGRPRPLPLVCGAPIGCPEAKRRRVAPPSEACYAAPLDACIAEQCVLGGVGVVGSAGDDALASSQDDGTAAGSLCCEETRDSLEDCSSLDAEEGFVVYQSPLSLGPEGQGQGDGGDGAAGGDGGGPGPGVLGDCGPVPLLAGDPDLEEMLSVLFDAESELQPSATYLEQHGPCCAAPDLYLDASMRRIIAGWLVEVAWEFKLHQETLFLSTALLDRFLSVSKNVPRQQLQMVGVACMLIAAKHEEEMHPSIADFCNIASNYFMPADLLRMEAAVLDCLGFRVNTPTTHTFLSMYKQALGLPPRTCALASYLTELAMLEYDLLHFRPSHIAAAATLLAKLYTGDMAGISAMPAVTHASTDDLKPCMRHLLHLQRAAHATTDYECPYVAVRDKYVLPEWFSVATTTPYERLPTALLAAAGGERAGAPPAAACRR